MFLIIQGSFSNQVGLRSGVEVQCAFNVDGATGVRESLAWAESRENWIQSGSWAPSEDWSAPMRCMIASDRKWEIQRKYLLYRVCCSRGQESLVGFMIDQFSTHLSRTNFTSTDSVWILQQKHYIKLNFIQCYLYIKSFLLHKCEINFLWVWRLLRYRILVLHGVNIFRNTLLSTIHSGTIKEPLNIIRKASTNFIKKIMLFYRSKFLKFYLKLGFGILLSIIIH